MEETRPRCLNLGIISGLIVTPILGVGYFGCYHTYSRRYCHGDSCTSLLLCIASFSALLPVILWRLPCTICNKTVCSLTQGHCHRQTPWCRAMKRATLTHTWGLNNSNARIGVGTHDDRMALRKAASSLVQSLSSTSAEGFGSLLPASVRASEVVFR